MNDPRARIWFALTALPVVAGVIIQLFVTADAEPGFFHSTVSRTLNVFCFFTILST